MSKTIQSAEFLGALSGRLAGPLMKLACVRLAKKIFHH